MDEAAELRTERAAIAELITRYAALNDAGDWDALAALYTEDGRMSRPTAPDEFISGRAAILAPFRSRPRRASRHVVANVLVTLEDDARARASSQILLFTGSVAADGGLPLLSAAAAADRQLCTTRCVKIRARVALRRTAWEPRLSGPG